MRRSAVVGVLAILAVFMMTAGPAEPCTTVIVGKARTMDGSVLIAHSEDDEGAVVLHNVVRPAHKGGSYPLFANGSVAEPSQTVAYMGPTVFDKAFIPGDYFGGVNAFQVAAYNNQATSRLGSLKTEGGMMWTEFNELAMMQARTAREAVQIIGRLNEEHTLTNDPGTMFGVADPNEGWWIEIGPGGQWAAQRVPDDGTQIIANAYRIGIIDFSDTAHKTFMWSSKVVEYAREKGWYDPSSGPFDFARAYGRAEDQSGAYNTVRHTMVERFLSAHPRLTTSDLMALMRSHYEGTEYDQRVSQPTEAPHHTKIRTVCTHRTPASFVTQLRGWLPAPIGAVVWVSYCSPCSSVFVPWYGGVSGFPAPYTTGTDKDKKDSAWWAFSDLTKHVDAHYAATNPTVRAGFAGLEERELEEQPIVDKVAAALWKHDRELATWYITTVSGRYATEAYDITRALLKRFAAPETSGDAPAPPSSPISLLSGPTGERPAPKP
jgi:dipeptidase